MVNTRSMTGETASVDPQHFLQTSGATDPVWVHLDPPSNRPKFSSLQQDLETDVCIVGAGIAGISIAYELVKRGREVVLVEALPRTGSGKIDRTALRGLIPAGDTGGRQR